MFPLPEKQGDGECTGPPGTGQVPAEQSHPQQTEGGDEEALQQTGRYMYRCTLQIARTLNHSRDWIGGDIPELSPITGVLQGGVTSLALNKLKEASDGDNILG